jgi:hypothetical protein
MFSLGRITAERFLNDNVLGSCRNEYRSYWHR